MQTAQCGNCAWFYNDGEQPFATCEAFAPGPIPEEILTGDFDHTQPYPGQKEPNVLFLPLLED